ncbi:hypothetical protein ACHAPU_004679 [Fusarium lateritium]
MEAQSSILLALPTEVLSEIVKEALFVDVLIHPDYPETTREKETFQSLKSLRLTHRTFAECDDLNRILFSNICLEPTRGSLKSIQRGDFSRVAPHVRSVTFATPPSWTLPREAYEKILTRSQDSSVPISPGALQSAYDAYITEARDTQALLEDSESELKQVWTRVLKSFGNRLERVRLLSYDCEEIRQVDYLDASIETGLGMMLHLPRHDHKEDEWACFAFRDENSEPTLEYLCKNATAATGDKLFAMVITCLAASGVAIPHLSIQMFMTGDLECENIPGWDQIDFSKLKKLHISPEIPSGENGMVERHLWAMSDSHAERMKIKAGDFCHDLLDKCHSSIQHFGYGIDQVGKGVLCWPTRRPTHEFPELTHLTQKGNIFPPALAHWLLHLKNLRHLELSGKPCRGPSSFDMRFLFSAIREHPNVKGETPQGLKIDFDGLDLEDWVSYSGIICKDSSIATKRHARDPSLGYRDDVNYALEAHFYGEVPLQENKTLRYLLGQWEEDESEAELDDSE